MESDNNKNKKIREGNNSKIITEKPDTIESANKNKSDSISLEINKSVLINNNMDNDNENNIYIKSLLNKVIQYSENNTNKGLIFKCPNKNCPFVPLIKYFEFSQTVSTKCHLGHEYHLSLINYFEFTFSDTEDKNCSLCLKKNYSNIKSISEFYCIQCSSYICQKCEMIHNQSHQIMEINKINTYCPIHPKTKFSGYCTNCKKDLCIHCLKDHNGEHHFLVKYLELLPSKEKINNYKSQIKKEIQYIEHVKNIIIDNKIIENDNEKKVLYEFCDKMKLKYYFYDSQLRAYDKIKFNIHIIKTVSDLFFISQNFFQNIYHFIQSNLNEYNKTQISNKIISTLLKYQNKKISKNSKKNGKKPLKHLEFKPLFSLNKNIKFIYLLKCGKILAYVENDGLYLYDDGTFVELLHIASESDIIDLCEDESGLIFLLKKAMIEIIQINENFDGYISKNKILFKTIDKINFICSLKNKTIIVSRVKRFEGYLEIWKKSDLEKNDNSNNTNNFEDKKIQNRNMNYLPERGRNFINMFRDNNRRLETVIRRTINNRPFPNLNINNFKNNNNIINNNNDNPNNNNPNNANNHNIDNIENNNEEEENNVENNNANNQNNDNNNQNNNNIANDGIFNNLIEQNNNNVNENIFIEEIPHNLENDAPIVANNLQINDNAALINNQPHIQLNNNNNAINFNIVRGNRARRHQGNQGNNHRPRFVHVIHFIRDQLQGLVNNLEQEELMLEDPFLINNAGIYGPKDPEIIHLNKTIKNGHEICSILEWNSEFFICSEFHIQKKSFKCIRIYSTETYEPVLLNCKIKIKNCSKDKNALIKIDNNLFGVCYYEKNKDQFLYGLSLVSFQTREEVSRIEMPKYNFVKKINLNKCNYLFVLLENFENTNNNNQDLIKIYKIDDKELIDDSSYFYDQWLNTYVYNKSKEIKKNVNYIDIDDVYKDINLESNLEADKDKELKFFNIVNSFELNNHYGNEIISMIKLKNNTFACLNKSHHINFYKIEFKGDN